MKMKIDGKFGDLSAKVQGVYQRNAERFDRERPKSLIERHWLQRFYELLPPNGDVLDVGCGAGEPIAHFFISNGCRVTGIDFSDPMLKIARSRFPDHNWLYADMRRLALARSFDGIIAWHSFFHLTPADQIQTLPRLARHLRPGAPLLLTVGPRCGEVVGKVGDEAVYHASLSPEHYKAILKSADTSVIEFAPEDERCGGATVLLARRL